MNASMTRHSTEGAAETSHGPVVRIDPAPFEALSSDAEEPRIVRWFDCVRRARCE